MKPRIIPCLLIRKNGLLYKSVGFKNYTYVGDPINAVRIFNEKEVDELLLLDIDANKRGNVINYRRIKEISEECFMPLCYGGGIKSKDQIDKLFAIGIEKIAFNSAILDNPDIVEYTVENYGSQAVVSVVNMGRNVFGNQYFQFGTTKLYHSPERIANIIKELNVGEILIQSIQRDGKMDGYDIQSIKFFTRLLSVPLIVLGGAGKLEHLAEAINNGATAVACGSFFVFQGKHRAVLITYLSPEKIDELQNLIH